MSLILIHSIQVDLELEFPSDVTPSVFSNRTSLMPLLEASPIDDTPVDNVPVSTK
jgi:hypothetical protein